MAVVPRETGPTGVPECDKVLSWLRTCKSHDPAITSTYDPIVRDMVQTWRQFASGTPEQRSKLRDVCLETQASFRTVAAKNPSCMDRLWPPNHTIDNGVDGGGADAIHE